MGLFVFTRNRGLFIDIFNLAAFKGSRLHKALPLLSLFLSVCLLSSLCWRVLEKHYGGFGYSDSVRVLSWWGYLDNRNQLDLLSVQCNTPIDVKDYMDVEELQDFAAKDYYDIYIYPWSYHKTIASDLPFDGPDMTTLTADYHPAILEQYHAHNMPKDSLFFQHATLGFVYDKRRVPDLTQLTTDTLFELASDGHVYLMDEIKHLNDLLQPTSEESTALDNWIRLYQMIHSRLQWHQANSMGFYFTNYTSKMLNRHLVLGVIDSGELINPHIDWSAVTQGQPDKQLGFGIHPKLSQVNSDILALKTHAEAAVCVAKAMGSREFLRQISRENYYFSPFADPIPGLTAATASIHQDFTNMPQPCPGRITNTIVMSPAQQLIHSLISSANANRMLTATAGPPPIKCKINPTTHPQTPEPALRALGLHNNNRD